MRFARDSWVVRSPLGGARWSAPTLHDVLWWSLAGIISLLAAILLWMIVTPVAPLGTWRPGGVRLMSPAARGALFAGFDPFNRGAVQVVATAGPGNVTALALTLFGVRINAATGGGSAIIAGPDGVQQVYRVGVEVMPGVTLAGVHFDHVELSHNGSNELLYLDQSKPAAIAGTTLAPSPSGLVAQAPGGPPPAAPPGPPALTVDAVRQGIVFVPRREGARITGLQVSAGADGSIFRAAGFQAGDVVTAVGGRPVSDAAALAAQLQPGQSLAVTVRRNGQQLPLAITLAP